MSYEEDEELAESFMGKTDVEFISGRGSRNGSPQKKKSSKYVNQEMKSAAFKEKSISYRKRILKHFHSLQNEFSLRRIFPILDFLGHGYGAQSLVGDVVAGVTVTLTLIPMAISFAALAGLPLQFGLYSSIVPGFIYAVFGHCPEISIGPTAVACILTYGYADGDVAKSVTLAFFTGLVLIVGGLLNLGFLVNYVSRPVLAGFVSGICCQVTASQITGLLGLPRSPIRGVVPTFSWVFKNLNRIRAIDATLGCTSIGILLFLRAFKDFKCCKAKDKDSRASRIFEKVKWVISVTRNSFILILTSVIAYIMINVFHFEEPLQLTGEILSGLPEINFPWQHGIAPNATNSTGLLTIVEDLGSGIITLPFINFVQAIAIVKHYSSAHPSRQVYPTKEMITLGCINMVGSFIGSLAVTGSLSRTSVNASSGVSTTLGGIITSILIIVSCIFLTPYLAYIPKSALSAVIMSAIIFTFDVQIVRPLWKYKKKEILPFLLTLLIGIFYKLQIGLIVGILTHLLIVLYSSATPILDMKHVKAQDSDMEYYSLEVDRSLYFNSVDAIKSKIFSLIRDKSSSKCPLFVFLDLSNVLELDFSIATAFRSIETPLKSAGGALYFLGMSKDVKNILEGVNSAPLASFQDIEDAEIKLKSMHSHSNET